jgi:hypothetical protein
MSSFIGNASKCKDEGGRTLAPALRSDASAGVKDEKKRRGIVLTGDQFKTIF